MQSAPQQGTTFTIYLPHSEITLAVAEGVTNAPPRGQGERVLLIDDESLVLAVTAEVLSRLGYAAVTFSDSDAALAAGVSELLVKPLQSREMAATLARVLHRTA